MSLRFVSQFRVKVEEAVLQACSLFARCARSEVSLTISSICCLFVVSDVVPHLPRALPGGLFMWLSLVFVKETIVDICSKCLEDVAGDRHMSEAVIQPDMVHTLWEISIATSATLAVSP